MENQNDTVVTETTASDVVGAAEVKTSPAEDAVEKEKENPAGTTAEETTQKYDQAYIDKLLADQKAAQDAAVSEALKVAKMDAASKASYEQEKAKQELADREAAIAMRELKTDAREILNKNDVPGEFLDMLVGKNLKDTEANVSSFKRQFDAAVQAQVEKRLVGRTPKTGSGATSGGNESVAIAEEIAKYMD